MAHREPRARLIRFHEVVVLLVCAAISLVAISMDVTSRPAVSSAETRFVETSESGLNIVPASCPSDPHYSNECSASGGGCTISANPSSISQGGIATLSWGVADQTTALGQVSTPANIAISGVGSVARSGITNVSPTGTTIYTLSGSYVYLGVTTGGFSCSVTVNMGSTCPSGYTMQNGQCVFLCPVNQHAVGTVCICDDTNYPPDAQGQCTMQQCPSGTQWVNGQCVSVSQCQLPTSCADETHVLNQCTGQATDCALTYGAGWYCSGGACRRPAPPVASISAVPSLVPPNRTTNVAWSSSNTASCFVSGTNGDGNSDDPWIGKNGSQVSSTITAQTSYTLTCIGLDGSTIKRTITVNIIPNWNEE